MTKPKSTQITNERLAREAAERIGKIVVRATKPNAISALLMNIARVYIETNGTREDAVACARLFGETLARYIDQHWEKKRGRH